MVKKKTIKKARGRVLRKSVRKPTRRISQRKVSSVRKSNIYSSMFLRLIFILTIIFGGYRAWYIDWTQGIYIISGAIVIWLIIELVKALRK